MAPFPAAHLNCGPLQELLKKLTGVNLPIWTAASGWTIKWLPEWPLLLSSFVFLPQTLSTFHLLHFSPLWFLLFILITFFYVILNYLPRYFSLPYLIPALFCTFHVFPSLFPSSASLSDCFCLSPQTCLSAVCERQTFSATCLCRGEGSLEDEEIKLSASI